MSRAKILVADDSPTELKMICAPILAEGYPVVTAADGDQALSMAASEKPALAVLDVVMPKKNGYQVCRAIKTTDALKHIKVILCTTKNQESDKFWGKKQGADAYITKPFDPADLVQTIGRLLSG